RLLMVELPAEQAGDIAIQHRLRECLQRHRPDQDLGVQRVPVVAKVLSEGCSRFVRLGHQFCVSDPDSAMHTLESAEFRATLLEASAGVI
ncbi:MAG: hypothetical protein ACKO3F_06175, partial [Cyanobium sp.]